MIKNIELIRNEIEDFSLANIEFIKKFSLEFQSEFNETKSVLDIDFVFVATSKKRFIVNFLFYNPQSVRFESGSNYHQISVDIKDIKNKGWENKLYEVIDYEEDTLHFYCTEIEITSIKETDYFI
jgi:hypothetical protein